MRRFTFYDTDSAGDVDYDISGKEYEQLLELCFRYGHTCSVLLDLNEPKTAYPFSCIDQYRIPVTDCVRNVYRHYGYFEKDTHNGYEIRHYLLCADVQKVIRNVTDSINKWLCGWGYSNPADPAFYREDGSVFFYSLVHEGVCMIEANSEENIDSILTGGLWRSV